MKTAEHTTASRNLQQKPGGQSLFQPEGAEAFFSEGSRGAAFFGGSSGGAGDAKPFFSPATIQPKLTIGQPGDKYEQEADAMADQVVQKLASGATGTPLQPKCATCAQEDKEKGIAPKLQRKSIFESNDEPVQPKIQRKCTACEATHIQRMGNEAEEEPELQAKTQAPGLQASSDLESRLGATKGGGSPLPENTRGDMESAFGADFSGVRVHTNSGAVQMNQELGAQAFTHGSDVYFNSGKYSPGSREGQRLLGHELTHVVQQGGGKKQTDKNIDVLSTSNEFQEGNYLDKINSKQNSPALQLQGGARAARPTELIQILTDWAPGADQYGFQLKFRCRSTSGDVTDLQGQAPNLIWREYVTYSRNDFAHQIDPPNPTILPPTGVSFAAANTRVVGRNLLEFNDVTDTHWMPSWAVREEDYGGVTGRNLPAVMESSQVYQYSPDGGTTWRYLAGSFTLRRTFFRTRNGILRFQTRKIGIHSTTENYKP